MRCREVLKRLSEELSKEVGALVTEKNDLDKRYEKISRLTNYIETVVVAILDTGSYSIYNEKLLSELIRMSINTRHVAEELIKAYKTQDKSIGLQKYIESAENLLSAFSRKIENEVSKL